MKVNISNTWFLPQEGFPVFYRYFRDRITWYEADAVCQFHHANLVTVSFNNYTWTRESNPRVPGYISVSRISSASVKNVQKKY
uniref:C-type lectin domain-containing protein n=1 Tax=Timema shepardi TaxID=629360 RepID=A0A7R9AW34_TIMSH|nr:unnamed protein product [Timema shepardi]